MLPTELKIKGMGSEQIKRKEDELILKELFNFELGRKLPQNIIDRLLLMNMRHISMGEKRLEIDTTLAHTLNVMEIVKVILKSMPELEEIEEEIILSAALHDIGKTGPSNNKNLSPERQAELQRLNMRLFSLTENDPSESLKNLTIAQAVEKHANREEAENILSNLDLLGFKSNQLMLSVYQQHQNNTAEILEKNGINEKIVWMSSHHHTHTEQPMDDRHLFSEEEIISLKKGALLLELADSFEAAKSRAGLSNEKNIEQLRNRFATINDAEKIINIMAENQENFNALFRFNLTHST